MSYDRSMNIEYRVIPSASDPTKTYIVTIVHQVPVSCTCPSWIFSATKPFECKHLRELRKHWVICTRCGNETPGKISLDEDPLCTECLKVTSMFGGH